MKYFKQSQPLSADTTLFLSYMLIMIYNEYVNTQLSALLVKLKDQNMSILKA